MKKVDIMEFEADDLESLVLDQIQDLAASIGWSFGYVEDDEGLDHVIIGTSAAITEIDKAFDMYTILEPVYEEAGDTFH